MSLLTRLFLLIAVAAIPALGAQLYAAQKLVQDRERAAHAIASSWANFAASEIELILEGARGILFSLAAAPVIRGKDVEKCGPFLAAVRKAHPFFALLGSVGADGQSICTATDQDTSVNVADRSYFQAAMASGAFTVGPVIVGRITGSTNLPLALRFDDLDGRPGGIVFAPLRLDLLIRHFRDKPLPPGTSITLVERGGTVVLHLPQTELIGTRISPTREWLLTVSEPGTSTSSDAESSDGTARVFGYVPLNRVTGNLVVSVGIPHEFAFAGTSEAAIGGIVVTAATLVLALIAAYFGARFYVEQPIGRLSVAAQRWAAGDLQARTDERPGNSKLDRLAQTFNAMAAALQQRAREQQQLIDQLRTLVGELNHRTKNSLAAIQAIMRQTVRSAHTLDEFLVSFESRLAAYREAHELLTEDGWETTSLLKLVEKIVAPFAGDLPRRFEIGGDDARLAPQTALAVALALGELATNAAKYGAFSTDSGRVRLDSEFRPAAVNDNPSARRLVLTWTEFGGPPVAGPIGSGLGSRLLQQLADSLKGEIEIRFNQLGVVCEISFPHAA